MKIRNASFATAILLATPGAFALTPEQVVHEQTLTEIAAERCRSEFVEGQDYTVKLLGDGKLEVHFIGKKGGDIKGSFVYTKNQWEGRQKVLREHQADETKHFRKCKQEELDFLRKSYSPPVSKRKQEVDSCIAKKIETFEAAKQTATEGGARSGSKKDFGSTPSSTVPVCLSVGRKQVIITATITNTCCHGGRCSVTAPEYSDGNRTVCVTTHCWSESKLFGGGGCGKYRLEVTYKDVADSSVRSKFRNECQQRNS
jgi:hypothetical protein